MPNGSATTVATTAMRSDSATAVHSWGESSNTRGRYDIGLIRKLKPYFSKIALAAPRAQEVEIARDRGFLLAAVAATG